MFKVLRSTKSAVRFSLKHSKKYLLENRCQESLIVLWFSFGGADKRVSYSTGVLNPIKIGGRVLYRKEDVYNNSRLVA